MYYLKLKDDKNGTRWKVREAVSVRAAYNCIVMAMATGSIGGKDMTTVYKDGMVHHENVLADVVRVNSDNTEAEPYKAAY